MERARKTKPLIISMILFISLMSPGLSIGGDSRTRDHLPGGVYIDLTKDFYEALREEGGNSVTYSNDPSADRLRQIAVSSRFMVETNLQIIKQQERIIELLQRLVDRRK
jgi:hypothetical protein